MPHLRKNHAWRPLWLGGIILLVVLLAGCGSASSSASGSAAMPVANSNTAASSAQQSSGAASTGASNASVATTSNTSSQQKNSNAAVGPQYLIKTLKVSMSVKDTQWVAGDLQTWMSNTDPHISSAGTDYEQVGNDLYNISMTFSVPATTYPQVYRYLQDYTSQHGGQIVGFTESVQDVTNDYVDTDSRIRNLRGEQDRLLDLLSHAQAMGDILSIEQRLTDVEGQIEDMEAQLNLLKSQITYYTVSITLQPIAVAPPPPPPVNHGWSFGKTLHDAFAASLSFAQGLLTFVIWLLAFAIYIVPLAFIAWLVVRLRARAQQVARPKAAVNSPPTTDL